MWASSTLPFPAGADAVAAASWYLRDVSMHLDDTDFAAMDDAQRVSVLEVMIAGMIADNRVTPPEARRFEEIVLDLPWGVTPIVLQAMVKGARDRIMALQTREQVNEYVAQLAAKFPSPTLREKIVFTIATLMLADGELAQLEKNVLGLFVLSFGITAERANAIREALHLPGKPTVPPPPADEAN